MEGNQVTENHDHDNSSEEDPKLIENLEKGSNHSYASRGEVPTAETQMYCTKIEIEAQDPFPKKTRVVRRGESHSIIRVDRGLSTSQLALKLLIACQKESILQIQFECETLRVRCCRMRCTLMTTRLRYLFKKKCTGKNFCKRLNTSRHFLSQQ